MPNIRPRVLSWHIPFSLIDLIFQRLRPTIYAKSTLSCLTPVPHNLLRHFKGDTLIALPSCLPNAQSTAELPVLWARLEASCRCLGASCSLDLN